MPYCSIANRPLLQVLANEVNIGYEDMSNEQASVWQYVEF